MSSSDMWKANAATLTLMIFLNVAMFAMNNTTAWMVLGMLLLAGSLFLSYRQGMAFGHDACGLLETVRRAEDPSSPAHGQLDERVIRKAWSVSRGLRAALLFALPPYLLGCLYIVSTLLKLTPLILPLRLVTWLLAAPYWPCALPWTTTYDHLTGAVAAVLMISPFVLPMCTFAGYLRGPKLWARSEKAMAEGKRRAKAKSRVNRKKRVPRAQKPEI